MMSARDVLFCNCYRIVESRCHMFISKLRIKNFKQLKDVELNLQERTTILAGPNNSGKTSLIQLLNRVLSEKGFSYGKNDFNIYDLTNWANRVYIRLKEIFETIEDIDDERFKKVLTDNLIVEEGLSAELICNFSMEIQVDYNDTDDISNFADYIMDLDEEHHSFYFQIQTELDKESYTKGINENTGKLYDLLKRNENDSSKMTIINHLTDIYSAHLTVKYYFTDETYACRSEIKESSAFRKLFNFQYVAAARPVRDSFEKENHELSNVLIDHASSNSEWKAALTDLPFDVLKTLNDAQISKTIENVSAIALNDVISSVSQTSGGHTGTVHLGLDVSEEDLQRFIKNTTNASFEVCQKPGQSFLLNETSQGLGFSNLIYMHTQIESYIKQRDDSKVNLLIIEEPESHMHPQMQYVFSRKLLKQYDDKRLQGLISTHSSEIVRGVSFDKLRVMREETLFNTRICDLSSFASTLLDPDDEESDTIDFRTFFEEIGISELIFSDAAILYEGDTERMYIRKIISLPAYEKLQQKYIAYIQVGGAYAYNFKSLLEFLKIRTLIITDIDYSVKNPSDKQDILSSSTTNSTINKLHDDLVFGCKAERQISSMTVEDVYNWLTSINHIVLKTKKTALDGTETENDLIYLATQTEADGYSRTLEAAMLCRKFDIDGCTKKNRSVWKNWKKDSKLKFSLPNNKKDDSDAGKESEFTLIDILQSTSNNKTDFMFSVILNKCAEEMLPNYIKEGLEWLMEE